MKDRDRRPIPDPTDLTRAAVKEAEESARRDIAVLREFFEAQLVAIKIEMAGRDALGDERYASVGRRFAQAEAIRLEQKNDTTKSIEAALLVVRQENERIEIGVTKQIEAERETSQASFSAVTVGLEAVKDRVTVNETRVVSLLASQSGGSEEVHSRRESATAVRGTITAAVGVASLVITLIVVLMAAKP